MNKRRTPTILDRFRPERGSAWLFALSLALAGLYWAYTVSELKSVKDLSVTLQFANIPKDLMVVGEDARRSIVVEFKGPPDMLKRVREEDVDARVDVGKLEAGPQAVEIGQEHVRLPSSVEFVRAFPKLVHFTLDRRHRDTVPLKPLFTGHCSPGTQVLSWVIEPAAVQLEGPASSIRKLQHLSTQPIPLDGRAEGFETPVVATFSDPDLTVLTQGPTVLRVTIGEKRQKRSIGPVPIRVTHSGKSPISLATPSLKVMVEGPETVVRGLQPEDLVVEVDVQGLKPSDRIYQLRPAVRLTTPALAKEVEITGWVDRFVGVKVEKAAGDPPEPQRPAVETGGAG